MHRAQRATWAARERPPADGTITAEYLVACVRDAIGPDALARADSSFVTGATLAVDGGMHI